MPEAPKLVEHRGALRTNDGWSPFCYLLAHLLQQVMVPALASRQSAVYMSGNQFKQALHYGVETMEVESHRFQVYIPLIRQPLTAGPGVQRTLNDAGQVGYFPANALS